MARVNGGYQPTQPIPKHEPELSFTRPGPLMAVTVEKIRKEALRLISEAAMAGARDQALEDIGYIAGITDLANALIGEEDDE